MGAVAQLLVWCAVVFVGIRALRVVWLPRGVNVLRVARVAGLVSGTSRDYGTFEGLMRSPEAWEEWEEWKLSRARELDQAVVTVRVAGMACSAVGFGAVAVALGYLNGDHGLLDLDPSRVMRIGLERAVLAAALGVAGSVTAAGFGAVLRRRVRRVHLELRELDALALARGWIRPPQR